jgi:hypothetical protein
MCFWMRSRRLLCLLAMYVAAGVVLSAAAAEAGGATSPLLARFEPVVQLDPLESFAPTSVESFIGDSQLEQLGSDGTWTVVDAHPQAGNLPSSGAGQWRLNQRTCTPAAALGGLACYEAAWKQAAAGFNVYGRVVRERGLTVLQYWFFYYDDVYSYTYPPIDFIWQAHEGDWEVVNVVLSASGQPSHVGYSEHCLGTRRTWQKTPKFGGTHPVVHVATGSHANYFSAGTHRINVRCIPAAAVALFRANDLPLPLDFAFNGPRGGPASTHGFVIPIHRIGIQTPQWVRFPGYWGESQYFHAPPPIGSVAFGTSPVGPAYQAVWRDPLKAIASWPSG